MEPGPTDPADPLIRLRRESAAAADPAPPIPRGRLKVFFGMAPGVGKTYAMLAAAQRAAATGVDVVAGIVETHGRTETEQLLLGLDVLLLRRGETLPGETAPRTLHHEFDTEAALRRHPDILLIDELAHTNAPGSPRAKRWEDVQECLKHGLNVWTTLNVQHLESLNDVVAQITGVTVRETIPDWVVDDADEIELIDLPPDGLHERIRAGKVYSADNAVRAVDPSDGFFRKGNLAALRELALRRTAAWVDSDLRRHKADSGIRAVWPAGERILVAVSPSPVTGKLIRAAKRMAAGLHADLLAVYVESPTAAALSPVERDRLLHALRLAESLGATTSTISAPRAGRRAAALELLAFARARNVNRIVVGKTGLARWREALFGSFVSDLIRTSADADIYVIRGDAEASPGDERSGTAPPRRRAPGALPPWAAYPLAFTIVGAITAAGWFVPGTLEIANIAMVYLAGVVVAAVWLGRGPAVAAAVGGVLALDFFFVSPRLTFAVGDAQYLLTFAVMLAVGLLIAGLTTRLRAIAGAARAREQRTGTLYALARELAAAQDAREVAAVGARHLHDALDADAIVALIAPAAPGFPATSVDVLASVGVPDWFDDRERAVALWAFEHARPAGSGTQKLPAAAARFVPLLTPAGKLGVLGLRPRDPAHLVETANLLLLETLASQIASALERVTHQQGRQHAQLDAERERLRSALLSSVSHDLRTPLASITGAASTLEGAAERLDAPTRAGLLRTIVQESARLSDLIASLVFATRFEAGGITLAREWTTVEEIVGVGLAEHRDALAARPFRVTLAADLPMIRVDPAMLPQVVHNLVENALRYTPAGTPISVSAWSSETHIVVKVADEGAGLSEGEDARIFQRFYRGRAARHIPGAPDTAAPRSGLGLGLTICAGIIAAHGGRIWAESKAPRGVAFLFSLPLDTPQPALPVDASEPAAPVHAVDGSAL
ncbi:DUF4118 domain-containing protein [soil metagenome]